MKKELIAYKDPKSPASEMFRTLRTNIQFMNSNKELKTLLVTSTLPDEGKSWTAANLAVTFAQAGKRVLLVDADMRKGRQFNIFDLVPVPGLSNYLSGIVGDKTDSKFGLENFIQQTEIDNLFVITSGDVPPNPSELLVSERMLNLVEQLKEIFDITVFDGTPSLILTDAPILSRIVDSTIIVTAYNETKIDNVQKVKKAIENIGGNVAGVVINKMPTSSKKYEYYGSTEMITSTKRYDKSKRKSNVEYKIQKEINKKDLYTNFKQLEYNKEEQSQKDVNQTIDKTQDILSQIQDYLDVEKGKLKNGDKDD